MNPLEKDRQQRIDSLRERIEQLRKDKPDFDKEPEKWKEWANKYFPACKELRMRELTQIPQAFKGRIITPPLLLIGHTINIRFIPFQGGEWELVGLPEKGDTQTPHEIKVYECFVKWIDRIDKALEGFSFSMGLERFRKMKDWDYAQVGMPYEIQVKPDGFYLTKYTIIGKNKNGYLTVNCDYILDGRKIFRR